MKANMDIAELQ